MGAAGLLGSLDEAAGRLEGWRARHGGTCSAIGEIAAVAPKLAPTAAVLADDSGAFLAEADHRIANHLAMLVSYIRLKTVDLDGQAAEPSRASMHVLLDGVSAQVAAIARLHPFLITEGTPCQIEVGPQLHEVCAPFAAGLSGAVEIVEDHGPQCFVRPDQVLPLSQIVAEVVANAIKHACEDGERAFVRVQCHIDRSGAVVVEVIDRGGGFPPLFDPEKDGSLGFRLVRALSKQLGARAAFESTPRGVRFHLTLRAAPRPTSQKEQSPGQDPASPDSNGR